VGCDALQVYRGFDAATAKPDRLARERVRHHLVDCRDPREDFTLAEYVTRAERAIREIDARGRVPLLVGGTGLYLRGLLRGIVADMPADPALRGRLRLMLERRGPERLHRWLAELDPETAARVDRRDGQRIVRALQLGIAGRAWSERLESEGTWAGARER
jgi:tRNA dimethylallyltransferase